MTNDFMVGVVAGILLLLLVTCFFSIFIDTGFTPKQQAQLTLLCENIANK